jgi:sigma-B regulation protein RsbU (phosphoserine phosphatase)
MEVLNRISETFQIAAGCWRGSRICRDFHDVFPEAGALVLGQSAPSVKPLEIVRHVLRSGVWSESPAQHEAAIGRMNRILCGASGHAHEAAMFWSYFDAPSQLLRYVNAGHVPPFLFKADRHRVLLRLRTGGPVLGLLPHLSFQQGAVRLDPGDVLVLYSAGVLSAINDRQEHFGEDRLRRVIATCLEEPVEDIRARIVSSLESFTGHSGPSEDRTVIVVRFRGVWAREEACLGAA